MKLKLLNDLEYQKRFKEINYLNHFSGDNCLKVKYSEMILDFVGDIFHVSPPPKKTQKKKSGVCYKNAAEKVRDGFQYVEGIVTEKKSGFKISHAWAINPQGLHIDFTLLNTDEYEYKGIIVPENILYQVGFKNGGIWYCCLPYLEIVA